MRGHPTPLGAVVRGLVAGAVGTGLMSLHQKLQSSGSGGGSDKGDPWGSAPTPALVARKLAKGIFDRDLPAERIGELAEAMHWAYGLTWGAVYGLVAGTTRPSPLKAGPALAAAVWGASYAQLVPMGLYEPPWTYPPRTVASDLGYHLTYGLGVALGYAAVDPAA